MYVSTHRNAPNLIDQIKFFGVKKPTNAINIPKIDFTKNNVVIWVPGTGSHEIPSEFSQSIKKYFKSDVSLVLCDYEASWNFLSSIPHGYDTLRATIDFLIKNPSSKRKVFIAGISQGALITGELIAKTRYFDAISGVILLGHPGISSNHPIDSKILEINHSQDPTTLKVSGDSAKIIYSIDRLFNYDIFKSLYLLKVGFHNPKVLFSLLIFLLKYVIPYSAINNLLHPYSEYIKHFRGHDYTNELDTSAKFLHRASI